MKLKLDSDSFEGDFQRRLVELSGQDFFACYQCGKCSAGCISAGAMDVLPHTVIRMAWMGQEEELRKINSYWLCAACLTCDLRCPKGIDISSIMEALRVIFLLQREDLDAVDIEALSPEMLARIPQQALVAGLRKYTP